MMIMGSKKRAEPEIAMQDFMEGQETDLAIQDYYTPEKER
jgi:hypothetical protein